MQIIIPLSGVGKRFVDAGYREIKPLIKVNGKTIIEYVIDLFAPTDSFIFVVNEAHLVTTNLKEILVQKIPNATIVSIPPHKLGPVYAVQQAYEYIQDDAPCIINYCDFFMHWDYTDFLNFVTTTNADGAIPCYIGFHPHLLHPKNVYAGCLVNEQNKLMAIKEKFSFTMDKLKSHHSVGTYYFKTGALLKKYADNLVNQKQHLNGEYYGSMLYEQMLLEAQNIFVYDAIKHFCQWGTPQDLEEFEWWQEVFLTDKPNEVSALHENTTMLMPMAGNGKRFVDAGFTTPKPFILMDGLPMYQKALSYLPKAQHYLFISKLPLVALEKISNATVMEIKETTTGQAATCLLAKEKINNANPLFITPCDNGMYFKVSAFLEMQKEADVIIFTFKGAKAVVNNPNQYGWVKVDETNNAISISCKIPISDTPITDNAITGAFWFKQGNYFVQAAEKMIAEERRINGEYYADECMNDCIAMGLRVKVLVIDKYICWGTPYDLLTYNYWQSYFQQ
jgi:NDP-sugar pyrophosphorylase family protein